MTSKRYHSAHLCLSSSHLSLSSLLSLSHLFLSSSHFSLSPPPCPTSPTSSPTAPSPSPFLSGWREYKSKGSVTVIISIKNSETDFKGQGNEASKGSVERVFAG